MKLKQEITEFKWNEENDIFLDAKFNFIYANNGVGKSILTNYLLQEHDNTFSLLNADSIANADHIAFNAPTFTMKPNIKKIEAYEVEIDNILKQIE